MNNENANAEAKAAKFPFKLFPELSWITMINIPINAAPIYNAVEMPMRSLINKLARIAVMIGADPKRSIALATEVC